jgi:hypothetical protein
MLAAPNPPAETPMRARAPAVGDRAEATIDAMGQLLADGQRPVLVRCPVEVFPVVTIGAGRLGDDNDRIAVSRAQPGGDEPVLDVGAPAGWEAVQEVDDRLAGAARVFIRGAGRRSPAACPRAPGRDS